MDASFLNISLPLTMACWFNVDDATSNHTLMSIVEDGIGTKSFRLHASGNAGGDPVRATSHSTQNRNANSSTGYTADTWHHACGVFTSSTLRTAYIDGGSPGTNTVSSTPTTFDTIAFGVSAFPTPANYCDGEIAYPAVWDVALTAAEVASLGAGAHPTMIRPDSLVAYWDLNGTFSPEIDPISRYDSTVTGATKTDNPPLIFRSSQTLQFAPAAPPVGGNAPTGTIYGPLYGPMGGVI